VTGARGTGTLPGPRHNGARGGTAPVPAPGRGQDLPGGVGAGLPMAGGGAAAGAGGPRREVAGQPGRAGADVWVRRLCALVVAGVAAYSSYEHQRRFALHGGADPASAALWPLSVDGLMVLASLGLLSTHRRATRRARWSVRVAFALGVAVSLAANVAAAPVLAWQPVVVAGWPPLALVLAVELLMHGQRPAEPGQRETASPAHPQASSGLPAETATDRRRSSTAPAVSPRSRPGADGRPATVPAASGAAGQAETLPGHGAAGNGVARQRAEEVMWSHFQQERARGHTPTGAELDRVAGTNNYGRAVLARWRRTGRLPAADTEQPQHPRQGHAGPAEPQPAEVGSPGRRD